MQNEEKVCYVLDSTGKPLQPCSWNKGWVLIRRDKAKLILRSPFSIQLKREVEVTNTSTNVLGLDIGSKYTGIAVVDNKSHVLFKGTIYHRTDISSKLLERYYYRRDRRSRKRYRPKRTTTKHLKREWLPPSIKSNKDEVLRSVKFINRFLKIDKVVIEDVCIDIKSVKEGRQLYSKEFMTPIKLNENTRVATLMRDGFKCMRCGVSEVKLEAHHIIPRRLNGSDSIDNLITLCHACHNHVTGYEEVYIDDFYRLIDKMPKNFKDASKTMQGKNYLRNELSKIYDVTLTTGVQTSLRRKMWHINKTHSNDAVCITGIEPKNINIKDHFLKPLRVKKDCLTENLGCFKHRDVIQYNSRSGMTVIGYIHSFVKTTGNISFTTLSGKKYSNYTLSKMKLYQRNTNVMCI